MGIFFSFFSFLPSFFFLILVKCSLLCEPLWLLTWLPFSWIYLKTFIKSRSRKSSFWKIKRKPTKKHKKMASNCKNRTSPSEAIAPTSDRATPSFSLHLPCLLIFLWVTFFFYLFHKKIARHMCTRTLGKQESSLCKCGKEQRSLFNRYSFFFFWKKF